MIRIACFLSCAFAAQFSGNNAQTTTTTITHSQAQQILTSFVNQTAGIDPTLAATLKTWIAGARNQRFQFPDGITNNIHAQLEHVFFDHGLIFIALNKNLIQEYLGTWISDDKLPGKLSMPVIVEDIREFSNKFTRLVDKLEDSQIYQSLRSLCLNHPQILVWFNSWDHGHIKSEGPHQHKTFFTKVVQSIMPVTVQDAAHTKDVCSAVAEVSFQTQSDQSFPSLKHLLASGNATPIDSVLANYYFDKVRVDAPAAILKPWLCCLIGRDPDCGRTFLNRTDAGSLTHPGAPVGTMEGQEWFERTKLDKYGLPKKDLDAYGLDTLLVNTTSDLEWINKPLHELRMKQNADSFYKKAQAVQQNSPDKASENFRSAIFLYIWCHLFHQNSKKYYVMKSLEWKDMSVVNADVANPTVRAALSNALRAIEQLYRLEPTEHLKDLAKSIAVELGEEKIRGLDKQTQEKVNALVKEMRSRMNINLPDSEEISM